MQISYCRKAFIILGFFGVLGFLRLVLTLSLETSCDETAAAVVDGLSHVRSSVIATSRDAFAATGGVIPEDAARRQLECVLPVVRAALQQANVTSDDLDAVAVTRGPGLLGSLLVGTTCARTLAWMWKKPLLGVHHILGHLTSPWLHDDGPNIQFPIIALTVSGGHTELWYRESHLKGTLLGRTRDDAAGEAFDKGAALLGLPYPGGPAISAAAEKGDAGAFDFPLPLKKDDTLDFSFSGLKTALRYCIRDENAEGRMQNAESIPHFAAAYQDAICRHLAERAAKAMARFPDARELHVVGGVAANARLRAMLAERCEGVTIRWPPFRYCTDNAAMIGAAANAMMEELGENAFTHFTTEASLPLDAMMSGSAA